jgi:hypothetical protein
MPINRAALTALVDDDGSNTVGSLLTKALLGTVIFDPIDAALGITDWASVTYSGANFTATGGGSWTVDSGDQAVFRWRTLGKSLFLQCALNATTVAGTVSALNVKIPNAYTAAGTQGSGCIVYDNSVSVPAGAYAFVAAAGATSVTIFKGDGTNFAASTNNTYLRLNVHIEIQ